MICTHSPFVFRGIHSRGRSADSRYPPYLGISRSPTCGCSPSTMKSIPLVRARSYNAFCLLYRRNWTRRETYFFVTRKQEFFRVIKPASNYPETGQLMTVMPQNGAEYMRPNLVP